MLDYDIRTPDSARHFLSEIISESANPRYELCDFLYQLNNFDVFWESNINKINSIHMEGIRFFATHITTNPNNCYDIKHNGIQNLQKVLSSSSSSFAQLLKNYCISFDLENYVLRYKNTQIDINPNRFTSLDGLSACEELIWRISDRIYIDYSINGFMFCEDPCNYGSRIHRRPEILMYLTQLFPYLRNAELHWENTSTCYEVSFFAYIKQICPSTFYSDDDDPPYDWEDWYELSPDQRIKKILLRQAVEVALCETQRNMVLYIKPGIDVPPEQITSITKLP